ncbi:putative CAAX prenyl protease N terminal five membrane helices Peptidase family M48 [Trypanosoma vivax]|uniref:CAAX prenyl protease n=1 Tax=Trypanosoma vivax (strain Y486) TaxID=1055687 RepID=G0U2P2_TRYVY|nr:putative CAAX prenyl protease 1 [Trypanosoma vivax]KAH8604165.1 putative CAAX prenyl protease N terminal five membrane helices Peptidase family M48 [Trypanosoma vivax]CCC50545.1 putative CAAX prenyl protease 1 [Trypanosoma vivax Y486]
MQQSDFPFYKTALFSLNALQLWEIYLQYRQLRAYRRKGIPKHLVGVVNEKEFETSQAYSVDSLRFSIWRSLKSYVFDNACLLALVPSTIYKALTHVLPVTMGSFAHCYTYTVTMDLISTVVSIPFDLYDTFVIEERHGFNKMTIKEFVKDKIKGFLLNVTLLHPIMTGLVLKTVHIFGEKFPIYFFLLGTVLMIAFTYIYPTLIQPIFNKYTPIPEDSRLGKKIFALAAEHRFPLTKLYEVDGSRRSGHSNAYFYGFWNNKRIVLYDTLTQQMENDDDGLLAVLCHELGHWKYNHTSIFLALGVVQLFCIAFGARTVMFNGGMYRQFGFTDTSPVIGFELFTQIVLGPVMTLLGYSLTLLTRKFEFQADRYAMAAGYGDALRRGLFILHKENKSLLTPDPLYAALKYSHPPLGERVGTIDKELAKRK